MSDLISPEKGVAIVNRGKAEFGGVDSNGNPRVEYKAGGKGGDSNGNGIPEMDCSWMVYQSLKRADCNVDYMPTRSLNLGEADKYFGEIKNASDVRTGDLIVFNGHVGIVETIRYDANLGKYVGTL